ncbi:mannitol dehydrogenase family protein [Roseivivax sp. CAU 1761]
MQALSYDPAALRSGAAHIGTGAFHRAHQQSYYDDLARAGHGWQVRGFNLAPPDIAAQHAAQGGVYHAMTEDQTGRSLRRIGTLTAIEARPDPLDPVWDELSFVTLTITEKGYCHRSGTTELDPESAITADLADPEHPRTAPGLLCRMLERRMRRGGGSLTLASCDNVAANGTLLRGVMEDYARVAWPDLLGWMQDHVAFPVSMVDRIVPAMTESAFARLREELGADDPLGVVGEPFRQWVLEDRTAGARPELERVGVQIVPDVAVFEHMKHRLLNGLQSALAELGRLLGHQTSHEASCDPALAAWSRAFLAQQAETLTCPPGEDLQRYAGTALARLTNPMIQHPLSQIASDASFKLPQRILAPAAERRARGLDAGPHAAVVAAWIHLAGRRPADRFGLTVRDPGLAALAALRDAAGPPDAVAAAVLRLPMFPAGLAADPGFRGKVAAWLTTFQQASGPEVLRHRLADTTRSSADA